MQERYHEYMRRMLRETMEKIMDRKSIEATLKAGVVNLKYIKLDGTERQMRATLKDDLLPEMTSDTTKPAREPNPNRLAVWDLDVEGWRTINLDTLLTFIPEA